MSLTRKIAGHTFLYGLGQVLIMASGIISMPILTRALSQTDYGLMCLVGVTVHVLYLIFSGGLRHSLARFYGERQAAGGLGRFLGTYLVLTVGLGAAGTVVAALVFPAMAAIDFIPGSVVTAGLLAALLVFIRVAFMGTAGIYRMREQVLTYNLFELATKYAGLVLCVTLVLVVGPTLRNFYLGLVVGELLVFGLLCVTFLRERPPIEVTVSRDESARMLQYGLPLMLGSLATTAYHMGDRYVIKALLDARQLALYSVGTQLATYACKAIVSGFQFAVVPVIMNAWSAGKRKLAEATLGNLIRYYALAAFPIALGLVAVRTGLIRLIASSKYLPAAPVMPLVVGAAMVTGFRTPLLIGLHFARRTRVIALLSVAMGALNIVLNVALMAPGGPELGIIGAGIATLACSVLHIVIGHLFARPHCSIIIPWRQLIRYAVAAALMYACVVNIRLDSWLAQLIARVACGTVIYPGLVLVLDRSLARYLSERLGKRRRS
ncbi:MAG: lipopolysaccharide biosynthesis protein [bacterium]